MARPRYRKQISPRLLSGDKRESFGHGLPPDVKAGLFAIARRERQSVAWVLEQVIIDFFGLKKPEYKLPARDVHAPRPAATAAPPAGPH